MKHTCWNWKQATSTKTPGRRVAKAVAGSGLRIADPTQSRVDLIAEQKGLLRVNRELLYEINRVLGVTVYTMIDWQPVIPETPVASVKITPIAIAETQVAEVERICREADGHMLRVQPFISRRVGVLALDDVGAEMRERFEAAMERKLRWYGSTLVGLRYAPLDAAAVETHLRELLDQGADLLLTGGGVTIDPLDPIELALKPLGAEMVHMGAPTRGSMFWLARIGDIPIINVASCRMWAGGAVGDLILALVMAGETVTPEMILDIGYGGLPEAQCDCATQPTKTNPDAVYIRALDGSPHPCEIHAVMSQNRVIVASRGAAMRRLMVLLSPCSPPGRLWWKEDANTRLDKLRGRHCHVEQRAGIGFLVDQYRVPSSPICSPCW